MELNLSFDKKIDYIDIIFIIYLILMIPLSKILHPSIGMENGFLENIQIPILLGGATWCVVLSRRTDTARMKWFWLTITAAYVLLAARELSWGRVFFPIGQSNLGPIFLPMKQIPGHLFIEIGIGLACFAILVGVLATTPWKKLWQTPIPVAALAILVLSVIISQLGEEKMILTCELESQTMEELAECLTYLVSIKVVAWYGRILTPRRA